MPLRARKPCAYGTTESDRQYQLGATLGPRPVGPYLAQPHAGHGGWNRCATAVGCAGGPPNEAARRRATQHLSARLGVPIAVDRPTQHLSPFNQYARFRFPAEVIVVTVRWYLQYGLSYRDVEELLAERGIDVDHVTVFRWVQRFTPMPPGSPATHQVT